MSPHLSQSLLHPSPQTPIMNCHCLTRCILAAARHQTKRPRLLQSLAHGTRMSSSSTNSLTTETTINHEDDNVLAIRALHNRFAEFANDKGIFPLLNKKQTVSFKKRVKWSDNDRQSILHYSCVFILRCFHANLISLSNLKRSLRVGSVAFFILL